jgi:hypothetical protein
MFTLSHKFTQSHCQTVDMFEVIITVLSIINSVFFSYKTVKSEVIY